MSDQNMIKFDFDSSSYETAKLAVIGVGGAGGNAVNTMSEQTVDNVFLMAANTDVQVLKKLKIPVQIQLGPECTAGLGAGGNPNRGMDAAEESLVEIEEYLKDVNMLFVTAGMGGGTGTGAAPVIAKKAMEMGILTVGVVTKPFRFEGHKRNKMADEGLKNLKENVNTLVVIPNQKLLEMTECDLPAVEAFKRADEVLVNAVRGISDLITTAGYVNVDFADVKTIMSSMGMAIMGTGFATGSERALEAARQAITSPLLDNLNINGAKGVLVNITGSSSSLTLREVDEAVSYIQDSADPEADFIFGYVTDDSLGDEVKVTVIATGFQQEDKCQTREKMKPWEMGDHEIMRKEENSTRPHSLPRYDNNTVQEELDYRHDTREIERPCFVESEPERHFRMPSFDQARAQSAPETEDTILIPSYRRRPGKCDGNNR